MVKLRCTGLWEKLLVPAFIFYFALLYPFRAVNNQQNTIAGAAGGCMLVRRVAIEAVGGIAAIRSAVIDDCALGRVIKRSGRAIWLGLADGSTSLRGYNSLSAFWMMVVRSAFAQLGNSLLLVCICLTGMMITFVAPPVLFVTAPLSLGSVLGLSAFAIMAGIYLPTISYYRLCPLWSLCLPIAAILFGAMTLHSAFRHTMGHGTVWKEREFHT